MLAGSYASVFLGLLFVVVVGIVDGVPHWKCKKYDIGNVDKKAVLFINYADCPPGNCFLNVTMLSMLAYKMRDHQSNQLVLLLDDGVEITSFRRRNRIRPQLLVKHFSNTNGLNVDKKLFGSSGILIFDRFSSLTYKLPYSFEFQQKKNYSRILRQKNYNFIINASLFATIYENVCYNEVQEYSTEFDYDYISENKESPIINSKSQLSEKTILDIFEMQKENSGEKFLDALQRQKNEEEETEEDKKFNIPIRMILPVEHIHLENEIPNDDDKYLKYNYLVLQENNPDYHGHLDNDIPDSLKKVARSSEVYKTEDGFTEYEVSKDYKTNTKKILELKPISAFEFFTPSPVQVDEYDSTEKEMDILVTLFHNIPWW